MFLLSYLWWPKIPIRNFQFNLQRIPEADWNKNGSHGTFWEGRGPNPYERVQPTGSLEY